LNLDERCDKKEGHLHVAARHHHRVQGQRDSNSLYRPRRCNYFTTLLDNANLDDESDKIKIIPLPAAFDHEPIEVREFVMVLYDTLDEDDAANLRASIRQENVFSLAQLAHYFDAPVLKGRYSPGGQL
jgi:hypothetical protein